MKNPIFKEKTGRNWVISSSLDVPVMCASHTALPSREAAAAGTALSWVNFDHFLFVSAFQHFPTLLLLVVFPPAALLILSLNPSRKGITICFS